MSYLLHDPSMIRQERKKKHRRTAVQQLDAYIRENERNSADVLVKKLSKSKQAQLLKLVNKLVRVIEREEIDKRQAFKNLRASNEAIKETIRKLHDSETVQKINPRPAVGNIECLDTDRLLEINPIVGLIDD